MSDERRRYFRINDAIGLAYRVVGKEEAKVFASEASNGNGGFDFVSNFDNRIQTLLDACRVQSPLAAELLDLINKKLNFVIAHMDVDSELIHKVAYTQRQANVSACGLAFSNEESITIGESLHLELILYPSEKRLSTLAKVVACDPLDISDAVDGNRFFLRVNFTEINAIDQEMLIQHIVKRQGKLLKIQMDDQKSPMDYI